jgi:TonB family protein
MQASAREIMQRFGLISCLLVGSVASVAVSAQQPTSANDVTGARLVKLADTAYPLLAKQARIAGTVDVQVRVRPDGTVESAIVMSGHPMLRQAAVDSARQSQYACQGCGREEVSAYELQYTFKLVDPDLTKGCSTRSEQVYPVEFDAAHRQVTVSAVALLFCDPTVSLLKVRAAKCLYLWHCGLRESDAH